MSDINISAKTIDEAVQTHNQANGQPDLAGGCDLLVQIRSGIKKPIVIDLKNYLN